jgi:hypothetical protein
MYRYSLKFLPCKSTVVAYIQLLLHPTDGAVGNSDNIEKCNAASAN